MNLTDAELKSLMFATSESDWNKICDAVKAARGGVYPDDWFAKVMISGLMNEVSERWKRAEARANRTPAQQYIDDVIGK